MLKLNIQNFRIIRKLDLVDEGKLSIFVGYNESGKTSLTQAIKFAFAGEAFGHKGKNLATLITHGESRMSVRVQVNDMLVHRTSYDTGDSLSDIAKNLNSPKEVVPILFDSEMVGDGGNKAMRAYLTGIAEDLFDPSVHFANDEAVRGCADLAKRAGKLTVKAIVAYCEEQRAAKKVPSRPVQPQGERPSDAQLQLAKSAIEAAAAHVTACKADMDAAVKTSHELSQVAHHIKAVEAYRAAAAITSGSDVLGDQRPHLERVCNINLSVYEATAALLRDAGYPDESKMCSNLKAELEFVTKNAAAILKDHPKPPEAPMCPPEPACFADYQSAMQASGKTLPEMLNLVNMAVQNTTERFNAAVAAQDTAQARYDLLQRLTGAWSSFDANMVDYETNAQRITLEWERWNRAAKEIAAAHTAFLTQQSQRFAAIISDMGAAVLGGRKLSLDITNGITLNGLPIAEVSKSTRWRMEVSVMTAIARSVKSPLLLIDGADILDIRNRKTMTSFLMEHVVPHFKHVVLTMTAKDDIAAETPLSGDASRWIMTDGSAYKL